MTVRHVDLSCNQCEACMINGTFCHETGCPNNKVLNPEEEEAWRARCTRFVALHEPDVQFWHGAGMIEEAE